MLHEGVSYVATTIDDFIMSKGGPNSSKDERFHSNRVYSY